MEPNRDLLRETAQIVSSHLQISPTQPGDIPGLIREVYRALNGLGKVETTARQPAPPPPPTATAPITASHTPPLNPAVPVTKSVFPNYIVCLEDGKRLKMLKRHLETAFGMTPEAYRARWGLPDNYPMVAPAYAQTRSALAKQIGLGHRRRPEGITSSANDASPPPTASDGRGRGRPRKAAGG